MSNDATLTFAQLVLRYQPGEYLLDELAVALRFVLKPILVYACMSVCCISKNESIYML